MPNAVSIGDGAIFEMKPLNLPTGKTELAPGDDMNLCWDFTGASDSGAPAA